jgi:hypothetical protein
VQNDPRFVSEIAAQRYAQISRFKFVQEKGFFVDLLRVVPEINRELRRRKWVTFNEILLKVEKKLGNESWAREFFDNASKHRNARGEGICKTLVRGVEIDFSPTALNRFLGTKVYDTSCTLYLERERLDGQLEPARREVRDTVSLPGSPWLKGGNSQKPTKIQMTCFKHVARAWTELFVKSIESCSNSSEIQLDVAVAAKMIVEKIDFDLGNTLTANLMKIAENKESVFSLGHCNLITELCRAKKVLWYEDDFLGV